jgi:NAD dependent epimerase/dehydratase family enzyme
MARELALSSQRVRPARLEASGFAFAHPELAGALDAALGRSRS